MADKSAAAARARARARAYVEEQRKANIGSGMHVLTPVPDFIQEYMKKSPMYEKGIRGLDWYLSSAANMPKSVFDLVKGGVSAAMSPIDTAKSIYEGVRDTGQGLLEYAIPQTRIVEGINFGKTPSMQSVDQTIQGIKDKYGSFEKAAETYRTDPAGTLLDASTLYAPAKLLTNTKKILPSGKKGTKSLLENITKFPPTFNKINSNKSKELINTLEKLNLNLADEDFAKVQFKQRKKELGEQLDEAINIGDSAAKPILEKEVFEGKNTSELFDKAEEFGQDKGLLNETRDKVIGELMKDYPDYFKGKPIPLKELQGYRKKLNKELSDNYNNKDFDAAEAKVKEAIVSDIRDLIDSRLADLDIDIKGINKEYGEMLQLEPELSRILYNAKKGISPGAIRNALLTDVTIGSSAAAAVANKYGINPVNAGIVGGLLGGTTAITTSLRNTGKSRAKRAYARGQRELAKQKGGLLLDITPPLTGQALLYAGQEEQ